MSLWSPVWKITINGVEYTNLTISNVKISSGRMDIERQPVAGYVNLEILNTTQSAVIIAINDGVTIAVKDSSGSFINLFGGFVSDIEISITSAGSTAISQRIKLTALGALSRLPKALTTGVLSKDYDGNQIYSILSDFLVNNWNEVPAAETWNDYNASTTWANAENVGLGEIDTPGQYELAARTSSTTDIYSLVSGLATSGLGYLYEDANGNIGYADAAHRQTYFLANGYVDISANDAIASGLKIKESTGSIKNNVVVKYDAGEESSQDSTSIGIYGQMGAEIQTSLHNSADALSQSDRYLKLRAYPRFIFDSITYPIQSPEIDNSDRDNFLNIFMGMPIRITDLPINMLGGEFTGFVEGWNWNAGINGLYLTIFASPSEFSWIAQKWNDVNGSEAWNTLSATLEWENAIGVIS